MAQMPNSITIQDQKFAHQAEAGDTALDLKNRPWKDGSFKKNETFSPLVDECVIVL